MNKRIDNIILDNERIDAPPPRGVDRRDFLKLAGFTFGGALLAGCQPAKVEKAIPFLIKPEEVTPGVATWYATTCGGCTASCGVMAKNRDGRPIKLEGIPDHPISHGGLCPVGQAHLLELYDSQRLMHPMMNNTRSNWTEIDEAVRTTLDAVKQQNGAVRLLTGTITSPTTKAAIQRFISQFKNAKHIQYDALSCSAILDAHEKTHGVRLLPHYKFEQAEVILSFDADFLGTWISPVEYTAAYRKGRVLDGTPQKFSYHVQFESRISLTGNNADKRMSLSPMEIRSFIRQLASELSTLAGVTFSSQSPAAEFIKSLAIRLWDTRGKCLVVCGLNDVQSQILVNYINNLLGNYGNTVDINTPSNQKQGNDAQVQELIDELKSGSVSALILYDTNPVYSLPNGFEFAELMKKIPLTVTVTNRVDETASASKFVLPQQHALETWNDTEPVAGTYSLTQPVIKAFGESRPFLETLFAWMGEKKSAYVAIQEHWQKNVFPLQREEKNFQAFWDKAVYNSFIKVDLPARKNLVFNSNNVGRTFSSTERDEISSYNLVLYPTIALLDGRHAHNPWLQELPDPVTKIVWDNYVSISQATAEKLGVNQGDILGIEAEGKSLELPVHIQQGHSDNVVAIALGYGRKGTDRFTKIGPQWLQARPTVPEGELVGKNASTFLKFEYGSYQYDVNNVALKKTGKQCLLACTQEHHSLRVPEHLDPTHGEKRPIIQETTFAAYVKDRSSGSFEKHPLDSMWPEDHKYKGHHWGMVVDLTACTGCSACVVSCQAENNIPLVGKDEVFRNREMTWIRIDRYYDEKNENSVAHQPMMCQHCGNAPCETVCPVLATVHSEEGLNQQVYNRCVGTRYCSNNCPYKVRRFNWFEYEHGDDMHKLVLNPDITVRERGVMEKCSLCVQRIQEAKIEAKKNGVKIQDGDIQPACAQSCPAKAIVFGDMNDPNSELVKRMKSPRYYKVLEELGVRPSVGYLTLVRNREEKEDNV
jgi:molybdopterin-containing oxidoreductase family iron-sulfur binding subunit